MTRLLCDLSTISEISHRPVQAAALQPKPCSDSGLRSGETSIERNSLNGVVSFQLKGPSDSESAKWPPLRAVPKQTSEPNRLALATTLRFQNENERKMRLTRGGVFLLRRLVTSSSFFVAYVLLFVIICANARAQMPQDKLAIINAKGEVWVHDLSATK
jgi:hypothetical protein